MIDDQLPNHISYKYPLNITTGYATPVLNKISVDPLTNSLFSGYSNGLILRYNTDTHLCTNIFSVYENTDIIDIEVMASDKLLTCSHN